MERSVYWLRSHFVVYGLIDASGDALKVQIQRHQILPRSIESFHVALPYHAYPRFIDLISDQTDARFHGDGQSYRNSTRTLVEFLRPHVTVNNHLLDSV